MVFAAAKIDRRAVRLSAGLAFALALALPGSALAQAAPAGLKARVLARLSDPAIRTTLGKPAPEMASVADLAGDWHIQYDPADADDQTQNGQSTVAVELNGNWLRMDDLYQSGNESIGYLGYNPVTRRWTMIALDQWGNSNALTADAWHDNRLVFEGDVGAFGEKAHMRETITRVSRDEYRVETEEQVAGAWKPFDTISYTRLPRQ
jgi:hypothetical protein